MKRFSVANFSFILLLLHVHGKPEFTRDYQASKISQETQQFFPKFPSNSDVASLLPKPELPQHYETYRSPMETQYSPGTNPQETSSFPGSEGSLQVEDFPFETSLQSSEHGFSKDFESSNEPPQAPQFSYEIDSRHKVRLSPPPPAQVPHLKNVCELKCSIKCPKGGFTLLNLCKNVCKAGCLFRYSELIYSCTNYCANLMPPTFKSDKKKADGYLKYCYRNCVKIF